jgi:hypothetical protein
MLAALAFVEILVSGTIEIIESFRDVFHGM